MKEVICLFEDTGLSAAPWAEAGYDVYCYDIVHKKKRIVLLGKGSLIFTPWDANNSDDNEALIAKHTGNTAIVLGFPPCDDLAASGAMHFASKKLKNPLFQVEALSLVHKVRDIGKALDCAWVIENPVGKISTLWRKPDVIFNPWQYGGYLPEDDIHPMYPEYIEPRDAYNKKTCYWYGGGFVMPDKLPVEKPIGYSKQHRKLGGKSAKTKRIRSASPRGIAKAIYLYNSK